MSIIQLKSNNFKTASKFHATKIALKIPVPESPQIHDKFIPVPDYVIPQTRSGHDSSSRMVKRKTYRILVGKFQHI